MNVKLADGTARCADHFDASSYVSETSDDCLYCGSGMEFSPAAESAGDLEGWTVRQVTSVHRTPVAAEFRPGQGWRPTEWAPGTISLVCADVESFNSLLRLVGDMSTAYGHRVRSASIGGSAFRWTWERWTPDGTHMSDMIIASRIH